MSMNTQTIMRALKQHTIKKATEHDIDALIDHLATINNVAHPAIIPSRDAMRGIIASHTRQPNSAFFIALVDGQIAGFIKATGSASVLDRDSVKLSLSLDPDYRGHGIDNNLLNTALDWAHQQVAICRVTIEAIRRDKAAIRLYQQHGFIVEARIYHADTMPDTRNYKDIYVMTLCV